MPEKNRSNRIAWLDLCKGFAMALVLLGHSMRDEMRFASPALDFAYRICYIFHMTCFFWIAGYTYCLSRQKGRSPYEAAQRRLKKQFLPWAGYTLLIFAVFSLALHLPGVSRILKDAGYAAMPLKKYLLCAFQADNPWAYHLWFLYALMLMTLLISLTDAIFGGRRLREVCWGMATLGIAGMAIRDRLYLGSWWRLYDYISLYLPVMCLGVLMAYMRPSLTLVCIWGGAGAVYIVIRAVYFSGFSGNSLNVDSPVLRFSVYLLADILLPGVILLLARLFKTERFPSRSAGKRFLRFLGRESMLIYLLHQPFCCAFLGILLYGRLGLPSWAVMSTCAAVSLGVSLAAVSVRDRMRSALAVRRSGIMAAEAGGKER